MISLDIKHTTSTKVIVMCADIVAENFTWSFRLAPNSMESALIRRSMSALERIVSNASAHALSEALAASTDVGSLAQLLSRGDNVGTSIMELEPLAPSLARGVAHREQTLQLAGGAISAQEAGRLLGISRQAVDKRRKSGTLLACGRAVTGNIRPASSGKARSSAASPISSATWPPPGLG